MDVQTPNFNGVITRDEKAREYFASDAFYKGLRKAVKKEIINGGETIAHFWPDEFTIKKKDESLVRPVFERVQQEFPELNHFRIMRHGEILLDTKNNNLLRRIVTNTASCPAM